VEHEHLEAEALERLLALDRTEDQNRNLLHQIAVCPECRKVGGYLLDLYRAGALPLHFGPTEVPCDSSASIGPRTGSLGSLTSSIDPMIRLPGLLSSSIDTTIRSVSR